MSNCVYNILKKPKTIGSDLPNDNEYWTVALPMPKLTVPKPMHPSLCPEMKIRNFFSFHSLII